MPPEILDRMCEVYYPSPGSGAERLPEKERIAKVLALAPIAAHLRGTLQKLLAGANAATAIESYASYADLGDACQRTRRTEIGHVGRLEGLGTVETESRYEVVRGRRINFRNAFRVRVPAGLLAQMTAHMAANGRAIPVPGVPLLRGGGAYTVTPARPSASASPAPSARPQPRPQPRPQRPHGRPGKRPASSAPKTRKPPAPATADQRAAILAALADLEERGQLQGAGFASDGFVDLLLDEAGQSEKSADAVALLVEGLTRKIAAPAAARGKPLSANEVQAIAARWMPKQKEPHEIGETSSKQPRGNWQPTLQRGGWKPNPEFMPPSLRESREETIRRVLEEEEQREREAATLLEIARRAAEGSPAHAAPSAIVQPMPALAPLPAAPTPKRKKAADLASRFLVTDVSESAFNPGAFSFSPAPRRSKPRGPPDDEP
jgi:hypothetical protein